MASPAASLGHPDSQQDADFFGNFNPAPQSASKASAASARQLPHQQVAMDPFDLFGEGSTVPAPAAAASQDASADDGLFGDIQGHQGKAFTSCWLFQSSSLTMAYTPVVVIVSRWPCFDSV